MPVVINEIQITTTVGGQTDSNVSGDSTVQGTAGEITERDRQGIIAECIEEVMRMMKEKQER